MQKNTTKQITRHIPTHSNKLFVSLFKLVKFNLYTVSIMQHTEAEGIVILTQASMTAQGTSYGAFIITCSPWKPSSDAAGV